jgi:hypothetical protein
MHRSFEEEYLAGITRRQFFGRTLWSVGGTALASLLSPSLFSAAPVRRTSEASLLPQFAPKAKRVIYLFMSGAPSQMDLLDYKPTMQGFFDKDLPESVRMGQRLTTMTSGQERFPIAPSIYAFRQHGQCGAYVSQLLPHLAGVVDDQAIVRTVQTEAINHDPANTYIQTGSQRTGKPSQGGWRENGLGSVNRLSMSR